MRFSVSSKSVQVDNTDHPTIPLSRRTATHTTLAAFPIGQFHFCHHSGAFNRHSGVRRNLPCAERHLTDQPIPKRNLATQLSRRKATHPSDYSSVSNRAVPLLPPFRRLQPSFRRKPESALLGKKVHRPNHPKETLHPTTPPYPVGQNFPSEADSVFFRAAPLK